MPKKNIVSNSGVPVRHYVSLISMDIEEVTIKNFPDVVKEISQVCALLGFSPNSEIRTNHDTRSRSLSIEVVKCLDDIEEDEEY